ncbi:DUF551 domain-containing protein [Acinetobacter towneri]|uniref:DUF551 domain-containing protein n=1 Tax=Acinetobacter towneri TaxID=202956 RepID=UPI0025758122|nr:DUF551 domain-containing protein [Acinetobacter towneri]MDM1731459.1 DUF551 domain-containing protein [Acinetobacter towneri]MDM1734122.1 DUF551 domain-containing protein [Acinetobacter towneri]MDM1739355.1 DUF551 domain-containing protein [Acinetobacter towneri]MDM1742147.1 DUF551 domain-containing protein [Acinetobacter towneri]MDM1744722.1 DUF551 domain-containing protein [Acinetobacter towneri]
MTDIHKEIDSLKAKSGYSGKPQQWQYGFDLACRELDKSKTVQGWISVDDNLPETEPNTVGVVCVVVCSLGNVYRARYTHDVDVGVDTKYWSEFAVNYNGKEYEHYEINAKITHWMPLPEPPTKECG